MVELAKARVRRSFDFSASTYDAYAEFQSELADKLFQRAEEYGGKNRRYGMIADLGCGSGAMVTRMAGSEKFEEMVSLDLSYNMTAEAKSNNGERSFCLQADAESLPLRTNSCDLIVSNLMLQWTDSCDLFFKEAYGTLKPGGLLFATTLGPGTFREIRDAMTSAGIALGKNIGSDSFVSFESEEEVRKQAQSLGFEIKVEREIFQKNYESVASLLRSLKKTGVQTGVGLSGFGLGRRRLMARFEEEYFSKYAAPDGIPITYEALFITAQR